MDRLWKQFVASGTGSGSNAFLWARLKLTVLYAGIVAVIVAGFSVFLYQSIARNLQDAHEEDFAGASFHQQFVQDTLGLVENEIFLADLVILVVTAGVSYTLAGYTLKPIQRSMESQKIFSENASHELRTPLAVMKNETEILLRNPHPTKDLINVTLRSNIEEIDRMTKMAEDLLLLARSEHHITPVMEKIEITEVVRTTIEKMTPLADRKNIHISMSLNTPIFIQGNKQGLERILRNLFQNAIEHTPHGGSITAAAVNRENFEAVLKISDTGSGIEYKDLPHIFERFYKGDGTSGNGLGLSIVKELMNQHGGSIEITSAKGKGTTVTIRLPTLS